MHAPFKSKPLVGAVSAALVTGFGVSGTAWAANVSGTNAAGSVVAPVADTGTAGDPAQLRVGPGLNVRFIAADGQPLTTGDSVDGGDNLRIVTVHYASGVAQFAAVGPSLNPTAGATALDFITSISTSTANFDEVAFLILAEGTEDDFTTGDGTGRLSGFIQNIEYSGPTIFNIQFDVSPVAAGPADVVDFNAPTQAELTALGNAIPASARIVEDPAYLGPQLQGATKNSLVPDFIVADFDMPLFFPADNTALPGLITKVAGVNKDTPTSDNTGGFNLGGDKQLRFDNAGPFSDAVDSLNTAPGAVLTDVATNPLEDGITVAIQLADEPAYRSVTSAANVSSLSFDVETTRDLLYSDDGLRSDVNFSGGSDRVFVTLLLDQPVNCAGLDKNDFDVSPGLQILNPVGCTGASDDSIVLELDDIVESIANRWRIDPATGALLYNDAQVQVQAVVFGTPITTATFGVPLTSDLALIDVKAGIAESPKLLTSNFDSQPLLTGARVDTEQPTTTPVAADFNMQTAFGGTPRTIPFTLTSTTSSVTRLDITNPDQVDWDEDGTAGEAADAALYDVTDFNTGVAGLSVKFTTALAAGQTILYQNVFEPEEGEPAALTSVSLSGFPAVHADGAQPVVSGLTLFPLEDSSPASGSLAAVASETLVDANAGFTADTDSGAWSFGGSNLRLLQLNEGVGDVDDTSGDSLSTTDVADDTITWDNVSASIVGKTLTLGQNPGYEDAAGNALTTDGSIAVVAGATTFVAPEMVTAATSFRQGDASEGNVVEVVVQYDRGVKVNPDGAIVDGTFKLRASFGFPVGDIDIDVPAGNVDLTDAGTGLIRITVPDPGILNTATGLKVEYDGGVGSDDNTLQSVSGDMPNAFEDGSSFDDADDGDTQTVQLPQNSTEEITQDVAGTLLMGGSPVEGAVVKATLVRLVDRDSPISISRATITFPIGEIYDSVGEGARDSVLDQQNVALMIEDSEDLADALQEVIDGESDRPFVEAWVSKNFDGPDFGDQPMLTLNRPFDTDGPAFQVRVNPPAPGSSIAIIDGQLNGAIRIDRDKSEGGGPDIVVEDMAFANTMADGSFRLNVGLDGRKNDTGDGLDLGSGDLFILVAVQKPGEDFVLVTSAWEGFANHLPFEADITKTGMLTDLGNIDTDNILEIEVEQTLNWQGLGITGTPDLATPAVAPVDWERVFISIDAETGMVGSAWSQWADDGQTDEDEADEIFKLRGNNLRSAMQMNNVTVISNINAMNAGEGYFFRNDEANGTSIFIPVTGAAVDLANLALPAGTWSTVASPTDTDAATLATDLGLDVIIRVGSGRPAASWFAGEAKNSLGSISQGEVLFVLKN